MIQAVRGTPHQPDPNKGGVQPPIRIRFDPPGEEEPVASEEARKESETRRLRITKKDLDKYGYTEGCEGCRFKQAGIRDHRAHSEACRRRIADEIRKDDQEKNRV